MSRISFFVVRPPSLGGAQRRHVIALLLAERIGGDDLDAIALGRRDQRQRGSGAAAGVFEHGAARLQAPVRLGARDHGVGHAVLHAAGGVLPFELDEDLRAAARHDLAQRHE
jgi:hypothetical protein